MKSIVERLREERKRSEEFTATNFGLMVGDSFPDLVRELVANESIAARFAVDQLKIAMADPEDFSALAGKGDIKAVARAMPVTNVVCSYLYWGIEIGRQLEREAAAAEVADADTQFDITREKGN